MQKSLFTDARDYQLVFLGSFLVLGLFFRDWSLDPWTVPGVLVACWGSQWFFSRYFAPPKPEFNWKSPTITALGLSLLLRSNSLAILMLAAVLSIGSKYLFQYQHKHWFNPANFGIVATLLGTGQAWISPGQWGEDLWYGLLFLGLGGVVLKRVGRLDTSVAFLGSYALLLGIRDFYLGWTGDVLLHQLMSGSLLLFSLFMITDPRSIPNARSMRILWAVIVAIVGFILQFQFYITEGIFYALFLCAPLTLWLDRVVVAPAFTWRNLFPHSLGKTAFLPVNTHRGIYHESI